MSKRLVVLTTMAISLAIATPAAAASSGVETHAEAGKEQTTGKHNFEQWQTIKRLQVTR